MLVSQVFKTKVASADIIGIKIFRLESTFHIVTCRSNATTPYSAPFKASKLVFSIFIFLNGFVVTNFVIRMCETVNIVAHIKTYRKLMKITIFKL